MRNYEDIIELLNAPEGEHYQFKEAKNKFSFTEAVKCCCALSNGGGGKFVLGISDQRPRKVVGSRAFDQPERTRLGLIEKLHIRVDFEIYEYESKRILVFEVAGRPTGLPIQADGIIWWYVGDKLEPMPQEKVRSIYAEAEHDFSSDICHGSTIEDLDIEAIDSFRKLWMEKKGSSRIKSLSVEQLLLDCGALSKNGVTYAGLILFGTREALRKYLPQSEVIFEYRSSETAGPAQQREEFQRGFFAFYDKLWELVNLRNDLQHYQMGFFVGDVPTFNERVVREAFLNAASHRNYQMSGSIFVRQYRDRLVMENPGGFPPGITKDNIINRQSPRNRRIAEILALCGLVERSGQGMNLIYELSIKEAKSLPDFSGTDDYFVSLTLNGVILDKRMLLFIKKIGEERLEVLSTDDFLIVNTLYHDQKLADNLRPRINRLVEMGIIEHISRNKYVLARSLYKSTGKSGVHTRLTGLDRETNKALLMKHIEKNGVIGTPFRELQLVLPSHSRKQIHMLLTELRGDGMIRMEGKTSNAKWFIV